MLEFFVDDSFGVDEIDSGTLGKPFKTLDYCITTINSTRYNENTKVFLGDGKYYCNNENYCYSGNSEKILNIIGNAKNTILVLGTTFQNGGYNHGTSGFTFKISRLVLSLEGFSSATWCLGHNCNFEMENVFIYNKNNITFTGGLDYVYSPVYFKNCISNFETYFFGATYSKVTLENCYGTFKNTSNNYEGFKALINCDLKNSVEELNIDENGNILDSIDEKIGLFYGEYSWNLPKCLIKMDEKYYTILPEYYNSELQKFNSIDSKDFSKGFQFNDFSRPLKLEKTEESQSILPFEKFDNFQILFEDTKIKSFEIDGYKISEKVVYFVLDTEMVSNFTKITVYGGNVKSLIKINDNPQFFKYNSELSSFEEIDVSNIKSQGMNISEIADINFNEIAKVVENLNKITFAFLIDIENFVEKIQFEFLEIGEFVQKDAYTTNLKLGYKKISVQPTFSAKSLKINVL